MSNKENIREIILIGRDRDCNFICNDSSVSRHHAQIIDYGTSCSVVDLDSTNGTFVNGRKVSSETTLHAGDMLRVGNVDIPWQQLVQPPQEPKSNNKLLWILMPIIAALLIGGGLAVYFIYGHAKDKDEKAEKVQSEIVGELANQIVENKEQAKQLEEKIKSSETDRREKQKAQEEERQAKERRNKAIMEADKARAEADKAKAEAQADIDKARAEADKAKVEAQADIDKAKADADKAKAEADKAKADADSAIAIADSVKHEADKVVYENEFIYQLLDSLDDEQLSSVCRELNIKFHYYRFPAKEALLKAFWDGSNDTKQKITMALKEKQKASTIKSQD